MKKTIVIGYFGGPGSGKSTLAARTFSELKELGYNCELVTEYAKDVTWEQSFRKLENQIHVFGKQHHRMWRLAGSVDYIITDSPLVMSLVYGNTSDTFKNLVKEEYNKFENIDIFLNRIKEYNPKGRNQTEDEAKNLDKQIFELMQNVKGDNDTFDLIVDGRVSSIPQIIAYIVNKQ